MTDVLFLEELLEQIKNEEKEFTYIGDVVAFVACAMLF